MRQNSSRILIGVAVALCLADMRPAEAQQRKPTILMPANPPLPPKRPAFEPPGAASKPGVLPGDPASLQPPPTRAQENADACIAALERDSVQFARAEERADAGACRVAHPVLFRGVTLADGALVLLDSAVVVRCALASQLAQWIKEDLAPLARKHNYRLRGLSGVGGHACRGRNRQRGARLSEHASGNAFDVRRLVMRDGVTIDIMKDRLDARRLLRQDIRISACKRFPTVLGSGADAFHEDHLHVDLRERRGGYRLCQWEVR